MFNPKIVNNKKIDFFRTKTGMGECFESVKTDEIYQQIVLLMLLRNML